jgi:hypothetical protein
VVWRIHPHPIPSAWLADSETGHFAGQRRRRERYVNNVSEWSRFESSGDLAERGVGEKWGYGAASGGWSISGGRACLAWRGMAARMHVVFSTRLREIGEHE